MILAILIAAVPLTARPAVASLPPVPRSLGPWSIADEAELAPVREAFGFSEGLRALDLRGDFVSAEECSACHGKVYDEWRASRHSVSATNAIFLAGFTREPTIRCARCHVPSQTEARPFLRYLRERRRREVSLRPSGVEGIRMRGLPPARRCGTPCGVSTRGGGGGSAVGVPRCYLRTMRAELDPKDKPSAVCVAPVGLM